MSLNAGDKLGPYEIIGPLGKGGMGEVYRARDTKLGRDVAIKVLPEAFTADPGRMMRFQREAQVLALLDHPNIGAIYGLVEANGTPSLVLALVEGPTLDERIAAGPLPIEEAIPIAQQIIAALEYAHERGVIHRDLKPANVKITPEGSVKVLDFGLAKVLDEEAPAPTGVDSPTLTLGHTRAGAILGTAAYMSPEQAVGKPADRRSDIFSFGAVLYEMLTGKRAFTGDSAGEILVSVAKDDPDWSKLPPDTPRSVRELLRRCLTKDRRQRLQAIGEARIVLAQPDGPGEAPAAISIPRRAIWAPWIVAAVIAAAGLWGWLRPAPRPVLPVARVATSLPVRNVPGGIALSRDGTRLAFVSGTGPGQIYVRAMDQLDATPLAGTEGAEFLCFSPDGQQISFHDSAQNLLKKVTLASGAVETLAPAHARVGPPTQSWGDDGNILFSDGGVLMRIPAAGGKAIVVAKPDITKVEIDYAGAQLLPGGRRILVGVRGGSKGNFIVALDPKTGDRKILLQGPEVAQFVPVPPTPTSGYLFYYASASGSLMAVPFDAKRLEVKGDATPVLDGILTFVNNPLALLAISNSGTLAYVAGTAGQAAANTLVWVDRKGVEQTLGAPAKTYLSARVSPRDPNRIALGIAGDQGSDIWVYDASRGTMDRISSDGHSLGPVWTPDGKRIVYERNPGSGKPAVMWAPADRSTPPSVLATRNNDRAPIAPSSVSPDGKFVIGYFPLEKGLWALRVDGVKADGKPRSIIESEFRKAVPDISPDGHWVAYAADDTGRGEIYVSSFPDAGPKITVSTDGGSAPRWSRNGRELFYSAGAKLMAVDVQTTPTFHAGRPKELFEGNYRGYDPAPNGQRFLVVKLPAAVRQAPSNEVTIVFNWFEELRRRVPPPK
jgi:eukaryotic-like serine/threonine-protein kinase